MIRYTDAMEYTYTIIVEPAEEGGYVVTIPALDTATEGESPDEARAMAKDLIQSRIEALLKLGRPVPQETESLDGERVTVTLAVTVA